MLYRCLIKFYIFIGVCLNVSSICTNKSYGLYCTNIERQDKQIILEGNANVSSIFLNNVIGMITTATFVSFPNLKHLDIQFSTINNFAANLTHLNELYLRKNFEFPNLTRDFFEKYCQNLTILIIQDNIGLNISEGAFQYAKKLNHLTINNQNMTHLTMNHLNGLNELTYLDLKQNSIQIIDENTFEDLKNLNYLILSDNNITFFKENTFRNMANLQSLDLFNLKLNTTSMNKNTFVSQRQLNYIGIPTKLIKENLSLKNLTNIFSNLETIGLKMQDQNDTSMNRFIETCKYSGFNIKLI